MFSFGNNVVSEDCNWCPFKKNMCMKSWEQVNLHPPTVEQKSLLKCMIQVPNILRIHENTCNELYDYIINFYSVHIVNLLSIHFYNLISYKKVLKRILWQPTASCYSLNSSTGFCCSSNLSVFVHFPW